MVLSHASEEGADEGSGSSGKGSLVNSLRGMLPKPKAKAA
jgi:hypothetical protein